MKSLKLITFFVFGAVTALYAKPVVQSDIFYEISKGNKKAIRAWLKTQPDLNIQNDQGQTLLGAATIANNRSIVSMLTRAGVNVNALDSAKKTALDHAIESDHIKIAYKLAKKNGQVTSVSNIKKFQSLMLNRAKLLSFGCYMLMIFACGLAIVTICCCPFVGSVFAVETIKNSSCWLCFTGLAASLGLAYKSESCVHACNKIGLQGYNLITL